jgi:hypothetical protein
LKETPNCVEAYDDVRNVRHGTQWSQQNYLKPPLAQRKRIHDAADDARLD